MARRVVLIVLVSLALSDCGRSAVSPALILATTTSVANSGLLDVLLPAFEQRHAILAGTHQVGSGRALRMLKDGDADVVISHAPDAESAALLEHPAWQYRKIMFNSFVIVGPSTDPAQVKGAADVADAMRRIAASPARFLSRGDYSGTHEREQRLWRLAGVRPSADRLVVAGAGMGTALRIASQTSAYTLTDRATFAQQAGMLQLVVAFEGGPELLNTYAVIVNPAGSRASLASAFADWVSDGEGREVIARYRIGSDPAFLAWPQERPRDAPSDTPR